MSDYKIPDSAVTAADAIIRTVNYPDYMPDPGLALRVLEAARPHLLAAAFAEAAADLGDLTPIYASNLRARAADFRSAS